MRDKDKRRNLFGREVFSAFVREMYLKGISKSDLAKHCRTSSSTVGWWFSERRLPYDRMIKICELFKSKDFIDIVIKDIHRILASDIKMARKGRYMTLKKELLDLSEKIVKTKKEEPKRQTLNNFHFTPNEMIELYQTGRVKHYEFMTVLSCMNDLMNALHMYGKNHAFNDLLNEIGERNA